MKEIESPLLYRNRYFIVVFFSYMVGGMMLSMWLAVHFRLSAMAWIGPVLFILPPGFFKRRFQMPFTKQAFLLLGEDRLTIQIYSSHQSVMRHDMALRDISHFRIYWQPKQNTIYFAVYLKDSRSNKYFFMDDGEKLKGGMVDSVFNYFKSFNSTRPDPQEKIKIKPSEYIATAGRIWRWCLSGICVISMVFLLVNHLTKEVAVPLVALGLIWSLWLGERIVDGRMVKRLES